MPHWTALDYCKESDSDESVGEAIDEEQFLDSLFESSSEILLEHQSRANDIEISEYSENRDKTCKRIDDWFDSRLEKPCKEKKQ